MTKRAHSFLLADNESPAFKRAKAARDGGIPAMTGDLPAMTLDIKTQTQNRGVVMSNGRGQPCTKSSTINETCSVNLFEYEKRREIQAEKQIVKLGPRSAHTINEGDLVWTYANPGASRHHSLKTRSGTDLTAFNGYPGQMVFACVNGLAADTKLAFVGQCNTPVDATNPRSDTAVSVTTSGTCTTVNTGPGVIHANRRVVWLATPFVTVDNGIVRPAIQEIGQDREKFRPMLVEGDELASADIFFRVIGIVTSLLQEEEKKKKDARERIRITSVDDFKALWRTMRERLRTVIMDYTPGLTRMFVDDIMPIDIFLGWVLTFLADDMIEATTFSETKALKEAMYKTLLNAQELYAGLPESVDPFQEMDEKKLIITNMCTVLACVADHYQWITTHTVGRAQTTSPPGAPLDLVLGYVN